MHVMGERILVVGKKVLESKLDVRVIKVTLLQLEVSFASCIVPR